MYGSTEAEEAKENSGSITRMVEGGRGAGACSLARILFRRVLLISIDGSMDHSAEDQILVV